MGSLTLAYPSIAGKTTQEQLESMRRYLCSVTEQLNLADWSAKATLTEISQAIDADSLSEAEKKTTLSGYGALKALIIKTADFAAANSETWSTKLSGSYVAISDFGKYLEKTQLTIEGNSVGIKQLYDYTAGVNNQFSVNSKQYIKTGLLYYKDAVPVYGVGVGNIETTVTGGGERVIDQTKNELVTVTPDRVSFWQDGQEVAYLSDKKLHFPSGTLEAAGAVLSGKITAAADSTFGPWTISESSIFRTANEFGGSASMYFGTSGLSIKDKFKVDANGKLTCTGASISGAITATSLNVTNASITGLRADDITAGNFSASRINGGILDFNNFSVDHLSASDITTGTLSADYIKLGGDMAVYSSLLGSAVGGYLGYTTGDYGGAGIHLMSGYGEVVATTSGAKLCYGQNTLSVTGSGAHTNCTMTVGGNLSVSGGAAPEYDGAGSLGYSNYRWSVVYAQTGTISTSDREKKTEISDALDRYDALFARLRPVCYRLKDGTSGRVHTGLIAQDVEQALAACGLTGQDFAAFVRSPREGGGADYGLRYEGIRGSLHPADPAAAGAGRTIGGMNMSRLSGSIHTLRAGLVEGDQRGCRRVSSAHGARAGCAGRWPCWNGRRKRKKRKNREAEDGALQSARGRQGADRPAGGRRGRDGRRHLPDPGVNADGQLPQRAQQPAADDLQLPRQLACLRPRAGAASFHGVTDQKKRSRRVRQRSRGRCTSRWERQLQDPDRGQGETSLPRSGRDPVYRQARQWYPGGRLAMQDTMGQAAAALTGGYGSSGQQTRTAGVQPHVSAAAERDRAGLYVRKARGSGRAERRLYNRYQLLSGRSEQKQSYAPLPVNEHYYASGALDDRLPACASTAERRSDITGLKAPGYIRRTVRTRRTLVLGSSWPTRTKEAGRGCRGDTRGGAERRGEIHRYGGGRPEQAGGRSAEKTHEKRRAPGRARAGGLN